MNPEENLIMYKSDDMYYFDEESGLKNWTIREIKTDDERIPTLVHRKKYNKLGNITIIRNHDTESFTRQIKHICFWQNFVMITWMC